MQLSKSTYKNSKKNGRLGPEERFHREWNRVQSLQAHNERLRAEVEAFAEHIIARIKPVEVDFISAKYHLAEKLLQFAERKSLNQWQREELFTWVQQVLLSLSSHPFSNALDLDELYQKLGGHLDAYFGPEDAHTDDPSELDEMGPELDEAMDDLFAECSGDEIDDDFSARDDNADKRNAQEQSLSQLLKSSSINKMFRQIASAIHPDREVDAGLKARRNQLMSELARARDEKDIPKIFVMYTEHVGASPLDLIGEDIEKVIVLLKRQADRLRAEQDSVIHANPLYGAVYERFYNKSQKKVDAAISKHVREVKKDTYEHVRMTSGITSLTRLKIVLEHRQAINDLYIDELNH